MNFNNPSTPFNTGCPFTFSSAVGSTPSNLNSNVTSGDKTFSPTVYTFLTSGSSAAKAAGVTKLNTNNNANITLSVFFIFLFPFYKISLIYVLLNLCSSI